jgi:hypothetical protein
VDFSVPGYEPDEVSRVDPTVVRALVECLKSLS